MRMDGDVDKNCSAAVEWYRKAAEQGYADAQYNIGKMYQYGYGVVQNYSKAKKWYRKAAEQGLVRAQNNVGKMYQNGYGVVQNYSKQRNGIAKQRRNAEEIIYLARESLVVWQNTYSIENFSEFVP